MLEQACPILPVKDVAAALERFRRLGFRTHAYGNGEPIYGFTERDGVHLHLSLAEDLVPAQNTSAVYLYVDDPDALYREWSAAIPDGHFVPPEDKPWGVREMVYIDPDSNLFRIGVRLA